MASGIKGLATVAMLASAIPAGAQAPESDTQAQISEVLAEEEKTDNQNTLPSEEVKIRLQIDEQLSRAIRDKKLKKLVDFYGKAGVKSKMNEMIDEIYNNPDKYGRFDSEGSFSILTDDGSLLFENEWESLYESKFGEYKRECIGQGVGIGIFFALMIACCVGLRDKIKLDKKLEKSREETAKLQEEIEKLEKEKERLKEMLGYNQ